MVADPGSAVLYRGQAPFRLSHPFAAGPPDVSLVLEFTGGLLDELFGGRPLDRDLGLPLSPGTQLAAATLQAALRDPEWNGAGGEERVTAFLGLAARDLGTARVDPPLGVAALRRVERVREMIASAPDAPHSLAELAREAHCSPFHLTRLFRRGTGMSLRRFRLHLRLAAALKGLADGADDLTTLALRSGFADHAHMSNCVRRAFGSTPSEIRSRLTAAGMAEMRKSLQATATRRS